jgi:hypothetical protein
MQYLALAEASPISVASASCRSVSTMKHVLICVRDTVHDTKSARSANVQSQRSATALYAVHAIPLACHSSTMIAVPLHCYYVHTLTLSTQRCRCRLS